MSDVDDASSDFGPVVADLGHPSRFRIPHNMRQPSTSATLDNLEERLGQPIRSVLQWWRWAGREALVHPLGGDIPRLIACRGCDGLAA